MPPLRRYLRITKHSVLEVRIYLDRPADADGWLLRRDNPALPRVMQAVRPLVLPKLREESERGKGRGGGKAKKKGVKDVIVEDDFEVSIFLTELSSRHSILSKQKIFKDKARIRSNSGKLTSWLTSETSEHPAPPNGDAANAIVIREEEDDDVNHLTDIPEAGAQQEPLNPSRRTQRRRRNEDDDVASYEDASDDSALFVSGPSDEQIKTQATPPSGAEVNEEGQDDKKKLGLKTSYDGFSIYGRILCLVVKRRSTRSSERSALAAPSQQILETWVSTQAVAEQMDDDEEAG